MKGPKRLVEFDLIRCVAILCVMIYHFRSGEVGIFPESWNFTGFTLGSLGVSVFFILSGAAIRYSDEGRYSLGRFVRSRFLSLFPIFWAAFFVAHCAYFLWFGGWGPFSGIPLWKIVYSIFALDGWLGGFTGPNYCVVGEWFLGCILIVYLLYPAIRRLVDWKPVWVLAIYLALVVALSWKYCLVVPPFNNPFFRGFEFACGVAFSRWIVLAKPECRKMLFLIVCIAALGFLAAGMYASGHPRPATAFVTIFSLGIVAFLLLWFLGSLLKGEHAKAVLAVCSRYSFAAFLCHHVIAGILLSVYLGRCQPTGLLTILFFVAYLVLVGIASVSLHWMGLAFSNVFRKFLA